MSLFDNDKIEEPKDETLPDGVYFNLSEAEYHALPRLSASGIKDILTSLATFWAKSWLNPDRETNDDDTKAQILGRAYHVAIFEPETLAGRYVGTPDFDMFEGMLTTDTQVKEALAEYGEPQSKKGENALERARRLEALGFAKPIKSIIMDEFETDLRGRQPIDRQYWNQIMRDIERIAANPEIHELVTGGASEVTILWTCPDSGIPMKSRIDKLKLDCFVDLKSFANKNGKPVNRAIADQVQYYKYYLSMRVYQVAISMIGRLNLSIIGEGTPEQHALRDALCAKTQPHQPWLFFQEKNGIPNLLARRLKLQTMPEGVDIQSIGAEDHQIKMHDSVLCRKADIEIARAKQLYRQAMDVYGTDQEWFPLDMIGEIGDEDFRDYFLEEMPA